MIGSAALTRAYDLAHRQPSCPRCGRVVALHTPQRTRVSVAPRVDVAS